jgi:hypothetical protein
MNLNELYESKHASVAMEKIVQYIQNKLGVKLIKIPGIEHYQNSTDRGFGSRYVFSGTTKCIRFNWSNASWVGTTTQMKSIDLFTGKTHDPNFNIHAKGISLIKTLPAVISILQAPEVSRQFTFPVDESDAINESVLTEAKRDDFTAEEALDDFMKKLTAGRAYTRSDFIGNYHISKAGIFDVIFKDFKDKFAIDKSRISMKPGSKIDALKDSILAKAGVIEVTKGGSKETFMKTKQEEEVEVAQGDRVPFGEVLEHLEGLVTGVIKGAFNALFVAGKGGTGKTQTVEKVLHAHGLSDGQGYFKNTGTASAAGVYTLLYHNRNNIIVFDDSDGALADQDARNLIKAATDTKKKRKLVWNKKSSFIFNPELEDPILYKDDLDMAPKFFDFEGRIIFISNLPLNKLDPDGALRTRAFVINVNPTDEEMYEQMDKILHIINLEDGLTLSKEERENVLRIVKTSKSNDVNLRKLVRGLNLAASGAPNFAELIRLYA